MSGNMVYRVNRYWANATQVQVSAFRFFWEILQYVNDHAGLDFVAYGTGASQTGTNPMIAWGTWATPPPMSNNAWFVFRATNAAANLNGMGTRPWQAKVQVFNSTSGGVGFDDPSGNDYGNEGTFQNVALRFSPDGGWAGPGTLNFVPGSGAAVSSNYQIFFDYDIDFGLHFMGDDDSMVIVGWGGTVSAKDKPRIIYLGETIRSRSTMSKPELAIFGRVSATESPTSFPGEASVRRSTAVTYKNFAVGQSMYAPGFALRPDGLTGHQGSQVFFLDGIVSTHQHDISYDLWTGKAELVDYVISFYAAPVYSIIGDLRFIKTCGGAWGAGALLPDGKWMQVGVGADVTTYGGIVVPWPEGVVPGW